MILLKIPTTLDMGRNKFLIAIVVIILILIGAYFFISSTSKAPSYSVATEKITIANIGEHSIFNIIAKEKGIADPADLRGKKVAVTKTGVGEFF